MPGPSSNLGNKLNDFGMLQKFELQLKSSSLTRISNPLLQQHGIELWIKRDDLLHPVVSGNKWRKLKYILHHALASGKDTIISMGGQYSNHLHALAFIGKHLGISTVAYIRGERPEPLTPTLKDCQEWGMQMKFISRSAYRKLRHVSQLPQQNPNEFWLPEGGAVKYALQGVAEMVAEIDIAYDVLCVPCGTATTLAGMVLSSPEASAILGFATVKGRLFLEKNVQDLIVGNDLLNYKWSINHDYHFGGFAKTNSELMNFINDFKNQTGIMLEALYTGKMLYGIYDLIKQGYFTTGQRIVAIHSGGLQGNRGFINA